MIYLDSSVVLAQLFLETRRPSTALWEEEVISSRLLAYEVWNRVHAYDVPTAHQIEVERLLEEIDLIELKPEILNRALRRFPMPVRTSDGLHLASLSYLIASGETVALASYDKRLNTAAAALGIDLFDL